jgi:hypothetical protein
MIHSRLFTFGGGIPCIEKLFILENYLDGNFVWIEKLLALKKELNKKKCVLKISCIKKHSLKICLHWKIIYIEKLLILKNHLHWKSTFIKKIACMEKLLLLKNCFHWKTCFHWKNYLHWKNVFTGKTTYIEKLLSL